MRVWMLAVLPVCAAFAPYPSALPAPSLRAAASAQRFSQPAMSLGESEVGEGRRRAILAGGASLLTLLPLFTSDPAAAFENRVEKRGAAPPMNGFGPKKGVGEGPDKAGKLKKCGYAPNCFSSDAPDPDFYYPAWEYTGKSKAEALKDIEEVVNAYKPGQSKIDGGGFKVAKQTEDYIWVQYESAQNAFIDDLEVALTTEGKASVRSSSRIGFLDFQVNAKRVNALAKALGEKEGWKTSQITPKSHPDYFAKNAE